MIKGKRVMLRPVREEDLPLVTEKFNDIEMRGEYISSPFVSEVTRRKRFDEDGLLGDDKGMLLITVGEKIIGATVYFKAMASSDNLEVGYYVWDGESRGKGYTTEAVHLMTTYLFNTHAINRVQLVISVGNTASTRVAEKAGFTFEGILRGAFFVTGRYRDMQVFSMLRSELGKE